MFNLVRHLSIMVSGSMVMWGTYTIITCTVNYIALPVFIIGLGWYAANNSKLIGGLQ